MTESPQILKKYPLAAAYLLGAFDSSIKGMDSLLADKKIHELVVELNTFIKRKHPEWKLYEIYWRGHDLKDAADDEFEPSLVGSLNDQEKTKRLQKVIDKIKHHDRVVRLTCHIGHLVYEDENGKKDHHDD